VIRVLRFDCRRTRRVVPTLSDQELVRVFRAVGQMCDDLIEGRYAIAEGAEEQLLGIAFMVRREAERRWGA
jgi:hypothetical protein